MLPPLLKILIDEPGLLAAHAVAYSDLIRQETGSIQARFTRRVGYWAVLAGCVLLTALFAGTALMLYAVTGVVSWLLWVVPAVPLVGALIAGSALIRMPRGHAFPRTRAQFDEDLQALGFRDHG